MIFFFLDLEKKKKKTKRKKIRLTLGKVNLKKKVNLEQVNKVIIKRMIKKKKKKN